MFTVVRPVKWRSTKVFINEWRCTIIELGDWRSTLSCGGALWSDQRCAHRYPWTCICTVIGPEEWRSTQIFIKKRRCTIARTGDWRST